MKKNRKPLRRLQISERIFVGGFVESGSAKLLYTIADLNKRKGTAMDRFEEALSNAILVGGIAMLAGVVVADGNDKRVKAAQRRAERKIETPCSPKRRSKKSSKV